MTKPITVFLGVFMQAQNSRKNLGWLLAFPVILLVVFIAWIEKSLSHQVKFSLLYFIPILAAARFFGVRVGVIASIACAVITLVMDVFSAAKYAFWFIPYLNAGMILVVYVLAVLLDGQYRRESQMARTDPLTGLLNRKAFFELLEAESERCKRYHRPVSIAYVDVDDFKRLNDKYGHTTGDRFLVTLARTLGKGSRTSDQVARLGGDEFAILMPETDENGAHAVLKRLNGLAQIMNKHLFSVTLSIGLVTFHKAPENAEAMIAEADRLMYQSKQKGKNRIETHVVR